MGGGGVVDDVSVVNRVASVCESGQPKSWPASKLGTATHNGGGGRVGVTNTAGIKENAEHSLDVIKDSRCKESGVFSKGN